MKPLLSVIPVLATGMLVGCTSASKRDLAQDKFPEAQAEVRDVLATLIRDVQTGNAAGLRDGHLKSHKFTKFGGREYERLDFAETVAGETRNITTGQDYAYDMHDVKIDVFGEVAIVTYYGRVTRKVDDEPVQYSFRQTLAFLQTREGWKIIHEHQSRKEHDVAHYTFPDAKEELQAVIQSMAQASANDDTAALAAMHLDSGKFTRFGGAKFERVGYDECIATETAFYSTVKDLVWDVQDLQIDVFGDVAVATTQAGLSYTLEGEAHCGEVRLFLVFLKTKDGWKIVHEHGTPKRCWTDDMGH